ncbi:hypothetical protein [Pseudaquabacterium pictum]|uniref:Lipoprotein n=1 Tax=Pseudaquabacterium pictum TaxID=2315236 RepID=A0A480AMI2_9BURK|nr:hypothetical protein [Rubrivivax pictus]GCL61242.1 hypothetical protein AQPW35_03230 [Rubrivivax pictus]
MASDRPRAAGACLLSVLALGLAGCATQSDVRQLATGRSDVSAYELNGGDVHRLRREAQRLCPLGGEIVREAGHSLPPEAEAGRWRSTMKTLAAWVEPPRRPAQLVVLCREPGDRSRLQAAVAPAPVAPPAAAPAAEWTAGLPIGPVNPEW